MNQPLLSVVIPCRLAGRPGAVMRAAFLRLCLTALDNQTADSSLFEVVIVDDASESPVGVLVDDLMSSGLRIRPTVVRNDGPPLGVAGAYNFAADHAMGKWLLLGTDDSLLAPDCIQLHLQAQQLTTSPSYLCGTESLYVAGVLFSDVSTGELHPPGNLSVRLFGRLLGVDDLRTTGEQLGFTQWRITQDDVRDHYDRILARSAVTPPFEDIYRELDSSRSDLRWLCLRTGNHSVPREAYELVGGMTSSMPGNNSDQDLGLKLEASGVGIVRLQQARSVLIEHWRNVRSYSDHSGLAQFTQLWSRPDVQHLGDYFELGMGRTIAAYREMLAQHQSINDKLSSDSDDAPGTDQQPHLGAGCETSRSSG